jgi:hypothetical protein
MYEARITVNLHTCVLSHRIDLLIIYGFMSCSGIFHLYGDITIVGEGLQNFGLCLALRAFEQGGEFTVCATRAVTLRLCFSGLI